MYIEQLHIDSSSLTMEELERYSWLLGLTPIRETLVRAEEEMSGEDSQQVLDLQREVKEAEEEAEQNADERYKLQEAVEVVVAFLKSPKVLTAEDLCAAAVVIEKFDPTASRLGKPSLEEELEAIGSNPAC